MELFLSSCFCLALFYHAYTDYCSLLLYDGVNIFLLLLGLLRCCRQGGVLCSLWGGLCLGALMLALYCLSGGGMGEGDVKLAAVLGVWLGVERGLLCLLLAFVSGATVGLALLLRAGFSKRLALPFGPFLAFGALAAYFRGEELLAWYKAFF
jgi:prepilin signal peptidase PulO-like enzyme (type II secretory pathway)